MSFFFNGGGFNFGSMGGDGFGFGDAAAQETPKKDVNTTKYYEILGVSKTATHDEIRKAYRKKAVKLHPDKGGSEEAFQELQQAYEVLSDDDKRKVYDTYGEEGLKEGRGGEGPGMDIFDFFNGGGSRRGPRKTKSILQTIDVTLEDIYLGKEKYLEISRKRVCQKCKGSGSKVEGANTTCSRCNGRGVVIVSQRNMGVIFQTQSTCPTCRGEGTVISDKDRCPECRGNKVTTQSKLIKIMLDKGAPDGKRYKFEGEADEVPGVQAGDVIIEINIQKHKKFVRKGADLLYNADITLLEALTGFEMVITHLDGKQILVRTKPGEIIKPGVLKTVHECGMPFFESPYRFGNLYINFNIVFPQNLDDEQMKGLKQLFPTADMEIEEDKAVKEKYTMTEYNENEENTYETGGRKPRRNSGDEDDEETTGGRQVRCENQ